MLERLFIVLALSLLGVALYQLSRWWMIRRTRQFEQTDDPILSKLNGNAPALVYFTADFCMACKSQQVPAIHRLRKEWGDDLQYIQIDAEAQPELAKKWGVMSLPTTFIIDREGKTHSVNYGVTQTAQLNQQVLQANQRSA